MNENSTPVPLDNQFDPQPGTSISQPETRDLVRISGGQPFNQNARKHGLYSRYLPPKQREDYETARLVKGVSPERALLRAKLAELLDTDPGNLVLLNKIVNTIIKLEAARPETTDPLDKISQVSRAIFAPMVAQATSHPGNIIGKAIVEIVSEPEDEE